VRAYWWHDANNFGDMLSPEVLEHVTGKRPEFAWRNESPKVLGVGSIVHLARPGDVVWGSGWHRGVVEPEGVRFLAVRGPLTAEKCGLGDDVTLGDPGLLMPLVFPLERPPVERRVNVLHVPHMADARPVCLVRRAWRSVILKILGADLVTTTSLHVLIVAEAYGVPVIWYESDNVIAAKWKARDYVAGTGRDPNDVGREDVLPPIPDLPVIQQRLIEAAAPLREIR
jgi:pyruvyltransferase